MSVVSLLMNAAWWRSCCANRLLTVAAGPSTGMVEGCIPALTPGLEKQMLEIMTPQWMRRQEWVNTRMTCLRAEGLGYGAAIERAWSDWRGLDDAEKALIQDRAGPHPPWTQG